MNHRVIELQLAASYDARYFLLRLDQIREEEIAQTGKLLDESDLQIARKILPAKDCEPCLLVCILIKEILGNLLKKDPSQLIFARNSSGKPYLEGSPLHFNLSYSGIYAFLGVHPTHPIGVAIEKKELNFPHPQENSHSPTLLSAAKEAYVKALGITLSQSSAVLEPCYKNRLKGISYFISQIPPSFPPLVVKEYNKIIKNYSLMTCINKTSVVAKKGEL